MRRFLSIPESAALLHVEERDLCRWVIKGWVHPSRVQGTPCLTPDQLDQLHDIIEDFAGAVHRFERIHGIAS